MQNHVLPIAITVGIAIIVLFAALALMSSAKILPQENKESEAVSNLKRWLTGKAPTLSWKAFVILICASAAAFGIIAHMLLRDIIITGLFCLIGGTVPPLIIIISGSRSKKRFAELYAQGLRAFASALQAGLSIRKAVEEVANSEFVDAVIRQGFQEIGADIAVGVPISEAFQAYAGRVGSEDAADVAAAISMQLDVGGSESLAISTISKSITTRLMTYKDVKATFAQSSVLILVMDFLPFIILGILFVMAPSLMAAFTKSTTNMLFLAGIVVFTLFGSVITHKLAKTAKGGK